MVLMLLKHGADHDQGQFKNVTPLMEAIIFREPGKSYTKDNDQFIFGDSTGMTRRKIYGDIATILLQAGANPNIAQQSGETPLYFAAKSCDSEMVAILLQHGADRNIKLRSTNETPLDIATKNGCSAVAILLKR
jgi:ankyrin repeat protein